MLTIFLLSSASITIVAVLFYFFSRFREIKRIKSVNKKEIKNIGFIYFKKTTQ
jgi:hypothetical protein